MSLGYHEFSEAARDVYALSAQRFRRQAEIFREVRGDRHDITFDDGHASQFAVALPVLSEFELSAIFFITTCWVGVLEDAMTWDQIRELRSLGHTVGSHTHTHRMLTACGPAGLRNELVVSRRIIEDRLGTEITTISLPGGRVDRRVLCACLEAGYSRVYTSRVGEYKAANGSHPEVIGRYIIRRSTTEETIASYLKNDARTLRRLMLEATAKSFVKKVVGDSVYQRAWRKAARSQSYGT